MDESMKSDVRPVDEQVPVENLAKAVTTLAEQKQHAFGPDGADLARRKAELQRQKIALHREGKL